MKRVCIVVGTRPEAIKMSPVIKALKNCSCLDVSVCVTAQHRQMMDQALSLFGITPDYDLDAMRPVQDLTDVTSRVLIGLRSVFSDAQPDMVLVHGDTTTTFSAALAAYYQRIPVGHVEAGLRTGNIYSPWPEELNRRLAGAISTLHFAPTENARRNLLQEGVDDRRISVTGNTIVDAVLSVMAMLEKNGQLLSSIKAQFPYLSSDKKMILVTGHRRENFGAGLERVCSALRNLGGRTDIQIVYPVHLNPNVREPVRRMLGKQSGIHLIDPLDYFSFIYLLKKAHLILTDSGGVQEEAPAFGKPVLVMRDTTERPEGVAAGVAKLVGTDIDKIVSETVRLLDHPDCYENMAKSGNPYGDGKAAPRITQIVLEHL